MRIIIKPLGMVFFALAIGGGFAAVSLKKTGPLGIGAGAVALSGHGNNVVAEEKWKFYTEKGAVGNMTVTRETIEGAPRNGLKILADRPGEQPWNLGISNALGTPFKAGEKLQLRFWGRSEQGSQVTIILQRNVPGFPDCFKQTLTLTPQWKSYQYDVTTTAMAQWESMIAVHAGFQAGSLELAGVELVRV
ncbi:hypothetical protein [Armatimonas rosea]|uniref:CBM-cenC domain-containing protein n=1 Tax=Armatimonas rosea TaxID=685828 RepID=A0A7W9SWP6_ARMRO|nr:hypothetical protein [Armatimonas rosea]MBB6053368.1 hypothetical protein [Armatimonas rosea]